jgi:hypothetical protein
MNLFERAQLFADAEHPSVEQLNTFVLGQLGDDAFCIMLSRTEQLVLW